MIGDFKIMGIKSYVVVNKQGTLEKLPAIRWYAKLWLYFLQQFRNYSVENIREFAKKWSKK